MLTALNFGKNFPKSISYKNQEVACIITELCASYAALNSEIQSQGSIFIGCYCINSLNGAWNLKEIVQQFMEQPTRESSVLLLSCFRPCNLTSPSGSQHRQVCVGQLLDSKNGTEQGIIYSLSKTQSCLLTLNPKIVLVSLSVSRVQGVMNNFLALQDTQHSRWGTVWISSGLWLYWPRGSVWNWETLGLDKEWVSKCEGSDS